MTGPIEGERQSVDSEEPRFVTKRLLMDIFDRIGLLTPLQRRIMAEIEAEALRPGFMADYDTYLGEVTRRVFGFNLSDLSPEERIRIQAIRKDLGIPGEFDPNA